MLFNATHAEETRVGIVDGQKLIDIDIESADRQQRKSNIYKGIITRIEPSLEACFVDYGEERHGFLPFKEVSRSYFKAGLDVRSATIREALSEGQEIIVQVEKEERGNKGAALTTFVSMAGRYLVLMPNNPRGGGVSRRIEGEERQELRETMDRLDLPSGMSTIARTAGIGRSAEELQWDLNYLLKLWSAVSEAATPKYEHVIQNKGHNATEYVTESVIDGKPLKRANPAPFLIVEESNLVIRAIRDYFQPDIGELLVDTDDIYDQARQFMAHVMPDMVSRVKRYREDTPLFSRFQIEHQIETAYARTVPLPSGGAIVIDHTEALVAVDVNSARATRGSDIEETAFKTNVEAADEVARQMRLRDLGGLIVIDFIDMADLKNQRAIEQRIKEAIRPDRARVQVGKISRFGLLELSRQRLRPSLSEGNHVTCPRCNGVGVIRDTESCALQVLRILQEEATKESTGALHAQVPVDVATYLLNEKRSEVAKLETRYRVPVVLIPNTFLETPHYHIERLRSDDERLEDEVASYKRAEDLTPVADDPYALKGSEEKAERAKQVPVIKSVLPTEVAPVHEPAVRKSQPAAAPAAVGLIDSIVGRIKSLFAPKAQAESEETKLEKKSDERRRDNRRGGHSSRDEQKSGRPTDKRRGNRGPRDEKASAERKPAVKRLPEEDKPQTQAAAPAAEPAAETRSEERRVRRPRRARQPRNETPVTETVSVPTPAAAAETVLAVAEPELTPQPAALVPVQAPAVPQPSVPAAPVVEEVSPDKQADTLTQDAPEQDQEPMIENDSRRRRPRRRRRPSKINESVTTASDQPTQTAQSDAPAVSETAAEPEVQAAPNPAPEPVRPLEVSAEPAEEPVVEHSQTAPSVELPVQTETAVAAVSPVSQTLFDTLSANLERAGLTQVHTDPALVTPVSYEPVKYPGRPRPVLPAVDETPLVQVHTDPSYL